MLAVDTNIVVRYLTDDHPEQSPKARVLIQNNDIFVSRTVLLESEWVLRALYDFDRARIADELLAFAGLPEVTIEDSTGSLNALRWFKNGLDFADVMHLVSATGCDAFVSFDKRLVKAAVRIEALAVRSP